MIELYTKLRNRGYARHPSSLFRYLQKQGFYKQTKKTKKTYIPKPYYTPKQIGIKWQLDVKYVPKHTKAPTIKTFINTPSLIKPLGNGHISLHRTIRF